MAMTKYLRVFSGATTAAGGDILIPINNIAEIEQATVGTTVINFSSNSAGYTSCTISHTDIPSYAQATAAENATSFVGGNADQSRQMRLLIQNSVVDALSTGWTSPAYDVRVPSPRAGFPAYTAGNDPVQVFITGVAFA